MLKKISAKLISGLVIGLAINACAIKHEVDVKGKVDPVQVEVKHYIILDTTSLHSYYLTECAADVTLTTQEEINACADQKLNDFVEKFTHQI